MTSVAIVIGIFFAIGIAVGVITVIAVSVLRQDKREGTGREDWGPDDDLRPDFGWASTPDDQQPRWKSRESAWPQRRDG
jgi:hypothetical protein